MRTFWRGLFWFAGIVSLVIVALRLTVFEAWKIPDDDILNMSIAPSLASGDLVLLWRRGERGFGELVRCNDPEDPQRWVIGRLVGLPGDLVEVDPSGVLKVNGTRYNVSDACEVSGFTLTDDRGNQYEATCSRIEMAGGWHFRARVAGEGADRPITHEVAADKFYLLSDNRSLHDDSRDFGSVDASTCKEAILFRLWDNNGFFGGSHRFDYIH